MRHLAMVIAVLPAGCGGSGIQCPAADPHPETASAAVTPGRTDGTDREPAGPREVFPFVRVDAAARLVEVDAVVPIDAHNPRTPVVFLEQIACTPDTREHEVLAMTRALPRHVHAALLMIGLVPGKPGEWDWTGPELVARPPTGDGVLVTLACRRNGAEVEEPAAEWVISRRDGRRLSETGDHFLFAGSRTVTRGGREWYEAEGSGTLIGLATFGGETVAWSRMYHHESAVEEPQWVADPARVPPAGTALVIRIRAASATAGQR